MKLITILIFMVIVPHLNATDVFQVGNVELNCRDAWGSTYTIERSQTDTPQKLTKRSFWKERKYSFMLNPGFFNTTWISITDDRLGGVVADGQQIFLMGNAPAGEKVNLYGVIGTLATWPPRFSPGFKFPLGFVPRARINCSVYWENTYNQ